MAKSARRQSVQKSITKAVPLPRITLTTEEVRHVYGLTAAFLRHHPEIPRIKCGHRTVVFKVSDIEEFLARRSLCCLSIAEWLVRRR